jgi:two-component system CheB/CheR fusion protein
LLEYDDLVNDARAVLAHLAPVRREVSGPNDQWYDIRLRPYRTVENKIDGVVITFVNISERRQIEEALRASEQSLRQQKSLVDRAREPIFIWDYDGGILDWNRGCEELYGFSRDEALGKRPERLLSTTFVGSSSAEIREILLREGSWRGEARQRSKDGRELAVESRIYLETIAGQRLAMENARDISELKQWEGRQQMLLDELAHRVKNTLAVVQSIAQQTLRGKAAPKEMVGKLEGRIMALARSHSQLVSSEWKGADFRALAKQQLEPYGADNSRRIRLKGGAVNLPADLATPFGLVLHELATNAAKHGSLSKPKGTVHLGWSVATRSDGPILTVIWE